MAETPNFEEMLKELEQAELKKAEAMKPAKQSAQAPEKPADDAVNRLIRDFVTLGTPACGLTGAAAGLLIAALLLSVGFWKTLLIAVFVVTGAFLGGKYNKTQWLKDLINKLLPPKN